MAITVACSVDQSLVVSGQPVHVVCTISNSGTAAVDVLSIQPTVTPSLGTAAPPSVPVGGPNDPKTVPAAVGGVNGTLVKSWEMSYFAPVNPFNPNLELSFSAGALVQTSDGSYTAASPVPTVQVIPPVVVAAVLNSGFPTTLNAATNPGLLSGSIMPGLATTGSARFDYNWDSIMIAVILNGIQ